MKTNTIATGADAEIFHTVDMLLFHTVDMLRRNMEASDPHFFDRDTMRFFASRVAPGMIGSRFFITSEPRGCSFRPGHSAREYRVRYVVKHADRNDFLSVRDLNPDGADDVPKYPTLAQARTAARRAYRAL